MYMLNVAVVTRWKFLKWSKIKIYESLWFVFFFLIHSHTRLVFVWPQNCTWLPFNVQPAKCLSKCTLSQEAPPDFRWNSLHKRYSHPFPHLQTCCHALPRAATGIHTACAVSWISSSKTLCFLFGKASFSARSVCWLRMGSLLPGVVGAGEGGGNQLRQLVKMSFKMGQDLYIQR